MKNYFKNSFYNFGMKIILFIILIFFGQSQNLSEIENSKFPITFTLYNGNILLITNSSIIFYNSFFNSTLTKYTLDESIIQNVEESYRTTICQYPPEYNSYVLLIVKDHLKIFKENGDKVFEKNLDFQKFPLYDIVPIKINNNNNNFYYMLAFTKKEEFTLNLYYYKVTKDNNNQENSKIYNLSQFNSDQKVVFVTNITCQLLKNETNHNILVCFYGMKYPSKIKMVSFDVDGDLAPINSMNLTKELNFDVSCIKSISNENGSKILVCFWLWTSAGYCIIYDFKNNTLSEPIQYATKVGSFLTHLNLYFFKQAEQYILLSKDDYNHFEAVIFDKNFEGNSSQISIQFSSGYLINQRETLIYSPQNKSYYLLADVFSFGVYSIKYMQTNISSYMIYNNNTSADMNTNTNANSIILTGNKCSKSNETSEKLNLCIECNKQEKYYPVYYGEKKNILLQGFTECFNNETKLINFFFNQKEERYEPCYETCRTCNYGGNATINNCTSCDFDGTFRPYPIGTTNCVKECRYRYYMTPYGQYKCSKDNQCNDIARLYIKEKNKCINNCSLDDTFIYQYNGECVNACPDTTELINNTCIIKNNELCSIKLNEYNLEENLTDENIDLLAKTYATEYTYTNNHISIFKHELYTISLYKNEECIIKLKLTVPQIDFGDCYYTIKNKFDIKGDLLVLIIEKYYKGKSLILYSFYHPITGERLNTTNLCTDNVMINENIIATLKTTDINIDNILKLAQQDINFFNQSSEFYNDICFHFESPNGKDMTLRDRILEFYPNITLCNEGCYCHGVNLTSMMAICECKFSEIMSGNIFTDNAYISKLAEDIKEIVLKSNLEILQCYKDIFVYKYFKKNIGGFMMLGIIFLQTMCLFIFTCYSMNNIRKFTLGLTEVYLKFINPKHSIKNNEYISAVFKDNPPNKGKKRGKKFLSSKKLHQVQEKEDEESESRNVSLFNPFLFKKNKRKINKSKTTKMRMKTKTKVKRDEKLSSDKINVYMKEYLSTPFDDMDYEDAIKRDDRKFLVFFWERVRANNWILSIIFPGEKLKPRSIQILIFLLNIDLYFVVNGLYFNEDYISEVYHYEGEEHFFDFISRTNYNFFYASFVGAFIEYMIKCFFVEEKRLKNLFRREKDNETNLRYELSLVLNLIKSRYIWFFITSYIITIFSWYYLTCFNNVYPNMALEWIKSSIAIIFVMLLIYMGLALVEMILRYLSFRFKSEKLFKFSKIFANCC